jgi:hypothetical protein
MEQLMKAFVLVAVRAREAKIDVILVAYWRKSELAFQLVLSLMRQATSTRSYGR